MPGLFLPETPGTDIERLLVASQREEFDVPLLTISNGESGVSRRMYFLPGEDFNSTERLFFLHSLFRFPLQNYIITSGFGPRINPVSNRRSTHQGLDLAAKEGSDVFAARFGTVTEVGYNAIYGNFIRVRHDSGWTSLYGHLSKTLVSENEKIETGSLIGKVGSTGQSTGPHLHFELRNNGNAVDPKTILQN
jgi:murein DD-endopeptidase MepM/ murein hydrolase activator NlpD